MYLSTYRLVWHHNPEDHGMNTHCHEMFSNFKQQRYENYNLWLNFIQSANDVSIF